MNELEHNWCGQQLAAYLADGLAEDERTRFEAHVHECDACTRDLDDARGMEANLRALFAPVAPAEDFEDRMVQHLRQRGMQRRKPLHPLVRRTAIAAAAAIALGSVGYISQRAIQDNGLISPEQIVGSVRALNEGIEQISFQTPATQPASGRAVVESDRRVMLNAQNAPIAAVLDEFAAKTGMTIVPIVQPQGRITLETKQPLTANDAIAALNTVLNERGYTALKQGNHLKIVNKADAYYQSIPVIRVSDPKDIEQTDEIVTAVIPLNHASAEQLRKDLAPMANPAATMTANASANSLLITDTKANIRKMAEVAKAADSTSPASRDNMQVTQLGYANASDVARRINGLYRSEQRFVGGGTVYGDVSQSQTRTVGDVSAYSFGNRELGISGSNGYGLTMGRLTMRDGVNLIGEGGGAVATAGGITGQVTGAGGLKKTGAGSLVLGSQSPGGSTMGGATLTGGMLEQPEDDLVVWSAGAGAQPVGRVTELKGDLTTGGNRNITVTGGTTSLTGRSAFTGSINVQSGIVNTGSGAVALGGASRAGDNSFDKRGGGVLSVTGNRAVTVNGGTMNLAAAGSLNAVQPNYGVPNSDTAVKLQFTDVAANWFVPTEFAEGKDEAAGDRLRRQAQQRAGQQSSGEANGGTLSTARSLGRTDFQGNFDSPQKYTIAGPGTITLDSGITAPTTVVQGNQPVTTSLGESRRLGIVSGGTWSTSANWTKDGGNIAGTVPNSVTFGTMSTAPTTQPLGGSVGPIQIAGAIVLDPPIGPSPSAAIERTELALANTQQPPAAAQPSEGGAAGAGQGQVAPAPQPPPVIQIRRVIREGVMEFEVVSFDSAFAVVTKITAEEGGFVVAADSDRLANGKVRGAITVRVPPDNLDTLILKLRALGDLKSQRLGSKDISKEYTDLESELRAGRAMEERLLEMIKNAQGEVKDLLEAEKELATWRIRLEKIQGQMNYYNNLVSLATLTINAYEKDIRTPATATQTEEINAGIEAEDVDGARTAALKAIDEVKGRIVESSLQQMNAGQFAAKIVADVAPEDAGQVVDRLRQIGRVARLDSQKKQTTGTGQTPAQGSPSPGFQPKVEQSPTRLIVSIYNLANVAPRLTTNLNLAADDVEATYRGILARVNQADGRVVSSKLDRQDANQVSGTIQFEVKTGDADAVLNDIRQPVQVLRLNVTENPDTANVTTTKQGFTVQIIPTAQVTPRLTTNLNLAAEDVEATYTAILNRIRETGGRVITSNLNRQDATQATGTIQFELRSGDTDPFMTELRKTVQVLTLNVNENTGAANLTGLKQGFSMQIIPAAQVNPREVRSLAVQTSAVDQGIAKIQSAVATAGGRVLESSMSQDEGGAMIARLVLEVPMDKLEGVTDTVKAQGTVRTSESTRNAQVPDGPLSRGRINLTIGTGESKTIVPATGGFWDTIRGGLSTSIKGLLWSLQLIIIGICLIGPWVLIVWGGAKWYKRNRRPKVEPTT